MLKKFIRTSFRNKKLITQLFTVLLGFSTLLIVVVSTVVNRQTTTAFINHNNLTYSNNLTLSMRTIDALLSGYHDSLTHITYDATIIDYIVTHDVKDSNANFQVLSVLNGYCQENEAIDEIYLYVKETRLLLSSNYQTQVLESSVNNGFVQEHLASEPTTSISKSGRTSYIEIYQNQIYIVRDFPLKGERRLATLFMKINPQALYKSALADSQTSKSSLLAFDNNWNPLFPDILDYDIIPAKILSSFPDTKYYNKQHCFFQSSELSHIKFILLVDDDYFAPSLQILLKNILPFFVLILILSTLLSISILYLTYMPMLKLTRLVESKKENTADESPKILVKNEWEYLTDQFLAAAQNKKRLDNILIDLLPKISKEFYYELLSGKPLDTEYIQDILININSPLKLEGTFGIICIAFSEHVSINDKNKTATAFDCSLSRWEKDICNHVMQQMDKSLFAIIVQFSPKVTPLDIIHFESTVEQNFFKTYQNYENNIWLEIGPKCKTIQNLSVSYIESVQRLSAQKYPRNDFKHAIEQNDTSVALNAKYFSMQLKSIVNFIMTGESDSARKKAHQICSYIAEPKNSNEVCRYFESYRLAFLDVLSTYHLTREADPELAFVFNENPYTEDMTTNTHVFKNYMLNFCTAAISLLEQKYQKQQHKYMIQAKDCIENHYSDPDLSLNTLAELCNTTTSYFSRLFKDSFGINFVDYLNGFRIEKAKGLLKTTNMLIKDIAISTGFNSQQNFIRVFKKHVSMTPGQYKAEISKKK